ncbi:MAG: glycosyltransferase [Bacteriovoracaceae bacterium]
MISVLLPTYNSAHCIERSVRSILAQTFTKFELLILDDGSTDNTESVIRSIGDPRICYFSLPHAGISSALNEGIRQSRYKTLARMDAGDLAFRERLAKQYEILTKRTPQTIVSCQYAIFQHEHIKYLVSGSPDSSKIKRRLALHPDFPHPGVMYDKEFISRHGMYRIVPLEDYDLWLRLKDVAEFHIIQEPLLLVEHSTSSLTNRDVQKRYRDHYQLQGPYFSDLRQSFGMTDESEILMTEGWREYFYGVPSVARKKWKQLGWALISHPALLAAFGLSFLPKHLFTAVKELRLKQRVKYLFRYYFREEQLCRRELNLYVPVGSAGDR